MPMPTCSLLALVTEYSDFQLSGITSRYCINTGTGRLIKFPNSFLVTNLSVYLVTVCDPTTIQQITGVQISDFFENFQNFQKNRKDGRPARALTESSRGYRSIDLSLSRHLQCIEITYAAWGNG